MSYRRRCDANPKKRVEGLQNKVYYFILLNFNFNQLNNM